MSTNDIEHTGNRFICCSELPDKESYYSIGAYPCRPAHEPESIRTGYALSGFFSMRMKCIRYDWLMEQSEDVQHMVEALWAQSDEAVSPIHYFFETDQDGGVTAVHFYLDREYYLSRPRE